MDRQIFFSYLRQSKLYSRSLPMSAVQSLDLFLDDTDGKGHPAEHAAYMMATAYHEVGAGLVPKRESLNYSVDGLINNFGRHRISVEDARRLGRRPGEGALPVERQRQIANIIYGGKWGKENLGNTEPNDGWDYRGGGYPQTTGRANYARIAMLTGVPLVTQPGRIIEPAVAIIATVEAMTVGLYTGKALSDYRLPDQFTAARAIINDDVKKNGEKIAGYARVFLNALTAAGYRAQRPTTAVKPVPKPEPKADPVAKPTEKPAQSDQPPAKGVTPATIGLAAGGIAAAVAAAYNWLSALPCEYLNLFCGS